MSSQRFSQTLFLNKIRKRKTVRVEIRFRKQKAYYSGFTLSRKRKRLHIITLTCEEDVPRGQRHWPNG
jgi:hypothetical protein